MFIGHGRGEWAERIAADCAEAARAAGFHAVACGEVTGPALALAGLDADAPSVMVTCDDGPAGTGGIAFNMPAGGLTRDDEEAMRRLRVTDAGRVIASEGHPVVGGDVEAAYVSRVSDAVGRGASRGMRVAVVDDGGSALARAVVRILRETGAEVDILAPGEDVVAGTHALVLLAGDDVALALADGSRVAAEVTALMACRHLGAVGVAVPVTMADGFVDEGVHAPKVRVDLASVAAAMDAMAREDPCVVGVGPTGGIMALRRDGHPLPRVPDRTLAAIAALAWCRRSGKTLAECVAGMGATAVGDVPGIDGDRVRSLVRNIVDDGYFRDAFFAEVGRARSTDETDGLHVTFGDGKAMHLRASGEGLGLRCHARASDAAAARRLLAWGMGAVASAAAA